MIPSSLTNLYQLLPPFALVVARISGIMVSAPMFGSRAIPVRLKVFLVFAKDTTPRSTPVSLSRANATSAGAFVMSICDCRSAEGGSAKLESRPLLDSRSAHSKRSLEFHLDWMSSEEWCLRRRIHETRRFPSHRRSFEKDHVAGNCLANRNIVEDQVCPWM